MIDRRPGRNPPSVLGSICLIGIPAPCAELIGVYVPFHRVGWLFILVRQPSQRFRIMGICWRKVTFLCQGPDSHPMLYSTTPPHGGRSFLKPRKARKLPTGSPTNRHLSHLSFKPFARFSSVCGCLCRLLHRTAQSQSQNLDSQSGLPGGGYSTPRSHAMIVKKNERTNTMRATSSIGRLTVSLSPCSSAFCCVSALLQSLSKLVISLLRNDCLNRLGGVVPVSGRIWKSEGSSRRSIH